MVYFLNRNLVGIREVSAQGDGSTISLKWYRGFPSDRSNLIAYNIYMSTDIPVFEPDFFFKGPNFVSVDGALTADITDLTPGQLYRFAVRPVEYNPSVFDLKTLPALPNGLRSYPTTLLRQNIDETDLIIPVLSVEDFPTAGTIRIGAELIQYTSLDSTNNNFVLTSQLQRGFNETDPAIHTVDGYDGYEYWNTEVLFFPVDNEDQNTVIYATQNRFDYPHYAFNTVDGYRQKTHDFGNPDMSVSDADNERFPHMDLTGYNRIDPVGLVNGECVGSYFGGQYYCADGYDGVGGRLMGMSVQDMNTQREELQLTLIGEPVVLMKRQVTGIRCYCILPTTEIPDARCLKCFGGGIILSYSQYFDPRNADRRIRMKFDPYIDSLPLVDSGLNVQEVKPNAWTLVVPNIKPRDFIVRFDANGNEEFRYEVINVTRNVLFNQQYGAQKVTLQRVRKTDIIYQLKVLRNAATMPAVLTTSINSSLGIPPHSHTIVSNEQDAINWQQITSMSAGHSHILAWNPNTGTLEISEELGHQHSLVY